MEASGESRSHLCEVCNERFERRRDLVDHRRIHSSSYPHVCTECNRAFRLKSNLRKHYKIHTGERPYTCNICNHKFREKSFLLDHKKKHSKEKPLLCEVCNRRFKYKRNLTKHMKIHNEERPYTCHLCHKNLTTKGYLIRHLRSHRRKHLIPEVSNEQLNERTSHDDGAEDHGNSSTDVRIDVQGTRGPLYEGITTHRTGYEGTDANYMIEPGGESSVQGTSNLRMEDPGEGPSHYERKVSQQTDNIESPSSEDINTLGMEDSSDSSSSWELSQFPRIENYVEDASYEDVIRGMDTRPSCEGININRMEDTPERPLPGRTSIDQVQNTMNPASSPRKDPLSRQGISILGLEYPGENVPLEDTGPREIQDPGEGPSCGIMRTNIGGEADLHQSWNLSGDMVPKAVESSDSPTFEEEQTSESPQSCEECGKSFKQEEGPLICEECDENLSGES